MTFSERLKEMTTESKETLLDLAKSTGIPTTVVLKYSLGARIPTDEHIRTLATHFDVSEDSLRKCIKKDEPARKYEGKILEFRRREELEGNVASSCC